MTSVATGVASTALPAEVADRFETEIVLKRDHFSTIERGWFNGPDGRVRAVLRRIDQTPWWTRPIARSFLAREARALAIAGSLEVAPRLLFQGRESIVRSWLDGVSLQLARLDGDRNYFRSAKTALRAIHHRGLTHNDLAKRPNWLRTNDGEAMLTDFQLATIFPRRGRTYRMFAYEDLRHLLKHKRMFCPDALTPREKKMLAHKALPTRIWMATGKRVYRLVTRGVLNYADTEGGGKRLNFDGKAIAERLRQMPGVSDVAIVAVPNRRYGIGLYAFVAATGTDEAALRRDLTSQGAPRPPEMLQVVAALPRAADGRVRTELLQIVATNQLDSLDAFTITPAERATLETVIAGRLNLVDR
jgi:acyl-CoA synthetase (AMP-forming)/AMP-acid ligase II